MDKPREEVKKIHIRHFTYQKANPPDPVLMGVKHRIIVTTNVL